MSPGPVASRPIRIVVAAALLLFGMARPEAWAQVGFEVPEGFFTEPEAETGAEAAGLRGLLTVHPEDGPFASLSTIRLSEVTGSVDDPDAWLKERIAVDIGDADTAKDLLESPDSPFGDPAFESLRTALPRLFEGLGRLGELPLEFCEDPTTGYNAAGAFRELYCVFELGPFRRFHVIRLQEAGRRWYFTEIRTMNERRLRHLLAIANSFDL